MGCGAVEVRSQLREVIVDLDEQRQIVLFDEDDLLLQHI